MMVFIISVVPPSSSGNAGPCSPGDEDHHVVRASRARDRTKIDDRSQPSSVAVLSHHCMKVPSLTWGSGYQADLWSSETSGMTVSIA